MNQYFKKLATLALFLQTAPGIAAAPLLTETLDDGAIRLGLAGTYLQTGNNFDNDGAKKSLGSGNSFQSINGIAYLQYGASKSFTLLGDLQFTSNKVHAAADSAVINNSTSGLGDIGLGARYQALDQPLKIYLDGIFQFPAYSRLPANSWSTLTGTSNPPLGEGISKISVFGTGELPLDENAFFGAGVGYTVRSSGFSDLLPYKLYLKYGKKRGFVARLGLVGQIIASDDLFSPDAEAITLPPDRSNNVLGGSRVYNAINPSSLKVDALVGGFLSKSIFVNFGVELPLSGKNSPTEPVFLGALGIEFGGAAKENDYSQSNRGFQQYYLASRVLQVNNTLKLVLIDKGANEAIHVGELLDVFEPDDQDGTYGQTVARGRVLEVGPTRSKVQLLDIYKSIPIQEGFVVRRPVR